MRGTSAGSERRSPARCLRRAARCCVHVRASAPGSRIAAGLRGQSSCAPDGVGGADSVLVAAASRESPVHSGRGRCRRDVAGAGVEDAADRAGGGKRGAAPSFSRPARRGRGGWEQEDVVGWAGGADAAVCVRKGGEDGCSHCPCAGMRQPPSEMPAASWFPRTHSPADDVRTVLICASCGDAGASRRWDVESSGAVRP